MLWEANVVAEQDWDHVYDTFSIDTEGSAYKKRRQTEEEGWKKESNRA